MNMVSSLEISSTDVESVNVGKVHRNKFRFNPNACEFVPAAPAASAVTIPSTLVASAATVTASKTSPSASSATSTSPAAIVASTAFATATAPAAPAVAVEPTATSASGASVASVELAAFVAPAASAVSTSRLAPAVPDAAAAIKVASAAPMPATRAARDTRVFADLEPLFPKPAKYYGSEPPVDPTTSEPAGVSLFSMARRADGDSEPAHSSRPAFAALAADIPRGWERHTTGVGFKIMAQMGFTGTLGKSGGGLTEPLTFQGRENYGEGLGNKTVGLRRMKKWEKELSDFFAKAQWRRDVDFRLEAARLEAKRGTSGRHADRGLRRGIVEKPTASRIVSKKTATAVAPTEQVAKRTTSALAPVAISTTPVSITKNAAVPVRASTKKTVKAQSPTVVQIMSTAPPDSAAPISPSAPSPPAAQTSSSWQPAASSTKLPTEALAAAPVAKRTTVAFVPATASKTSAIVLPPLAKKSTGPASSSVKKAATELPPPVATKPAAQNTSSIAQVPVPKITSSTPSPPAALKSSISQPTASPKNFPAPEQALASKSEMRANPQRKPLWKKGLDVFLGVAIAGVAVVWSQRRDGERD